MSLTLATHEIAHGQDHGCFFGACGGQNLSVAAQALLQTMANNDYQHATALQFQRDPQSFVSQLQNRAAQRESGNDGIGGI